MSVRIARPVLAAILFAGAFGAAPLGPAFAPSAAAQDKKKKDKDDDKEKKKPTKLEKAISDLGASFGAKGAADLVAKVQKDAKLTLTLGRDDDGDFAADQARGVLDAWFADLQTLSVDITAMKVVDSAGSFPLTIRKRGERKSRTGTLYVTVGSATATPPYPLLKLAVDQR
jgi:hypothetical protein